MLKEYIVDDYIFILDALISSLRNSNVSYAKSLKKYPFVLNEEGFKYIDMPQKSLIFSDDIDIKIRKLIYENDFDDRLENFNDFREEIDIYEVMDSIVKYWKQPLGIQSLEVINTTEENQDDRSGIFRTNTYYIKLFNPSLRDILRAAVYTKNAKEDWWYEGCPRCDTEIDDSGNGSIKIEWDHGS